MANCVWDQVGVGHSFIWSLSNQFQLVPSKSKGSGTSNDPENFRYTIKNPGYWKTVYRKSPAWARVGVTKENTAPRLLAKKQDLFAGVRSTSGLICIYSCICFLLELYFPASRGKKNRATFFPRVQTYAFSLEPKVGLWKFERGNSYIYSIFDWFDDPILFPTWRPLSFCRQIDCCLLRYNDW